MKTILSLSRSLLGYALLAYGLDEFTVFLDMPPRQCLAALTTRKEG